ncbi:MAG TPA: Coq4 family protein [Stellaceae bacterium]|nr:Coq4 family protein [Stellaceae bacterium]
MQPLDTRLHPIIALRAVRALLRDPEDTPQVFLLLDALRGKTSQRQLARFRQTEVGRAVLAERRRLFDRLNDRDKLAALPAGTLGRLYHEFTAAEHFSASGLAEISNFDEVLPPGEDMTLFRERGRDAHDLLHVVTGYGRDPLGEACLTAFTFAQTGLKGFMLIATAATRRIARALPGEPVRRAVFEGYRRGRRARWLVAADWEMLLTEPIDKIRAQFGVAPAFYYPRALSALQVAPRAAGQTAVRA